MQIKKTAFSAFVHTAVFLFFFVATALPAFAAPGGVDEPKPIAPEATGYQQAARSAGFQMPTDALPTYISYILKGFFGVLGILFLVLMIYGGLRWMMSTSATEVESARNTLVNAVIGLVVVIASYAVTNFVIYSLINKTVK